MTANISHTEATDRIADPQHDTPPLMRRGIRSYVQRSARLGPRLQRHWDRYADRYILDLERGDATMEIASHQRLDLDQIFGRTAPVVIEIGSGRGEMIAHAAAQHPEWDFISCEVYRPGVAGILGRIGPNELTNVRIAHVDAVSLLRNAIAPASLQQVWVFFPDPWHKTRHHKRRLINQDFADLVSRVLAPGGQWRIATDWPNYAEQIAEVLSNSPHFDGSVSERFTLRPQTRFEQKAHTEGRPVTDFTAVRR